MRLLALARIGFLFFVALAISALLPIQSSHASDSILYQANTTISDGKNGRPWAQWVQEIENREVAQIVVHLQKTSGPNDTYVNLRFKDGSAFENGKQVFLGDTEEKSPTWTISAAPKGKPLVLNAYNGQVRVKSVEVIFKDTKDAVGQSAKPATSTALESDNGPELARCRESRYRDPEIEIFEAESSGGLFSGKYEVRGAVSGACIQEAGYYEEGGKLRQKFEVPLSSVFQREEFKIKVRSGKDAEIRVYTIDGEMERKSIDDYIAASKKSDSTSDALRGLGGLLNQ